MIKSALQFSGGKDSLACLYLLRERWDDLYVVWLNTGAAYLEMEAYMARWKEKLPHFVELRSNQPAQIAREGWPADVVPVNNTAFAQSFLRNEGPLIQSYLSCCAQNIWYPMHDGTIALGVSEIIRGQRRDDKRKAPLTNGQVVNGVTYTLPIEDWSEADVFAYLKSVDADMPPGYAQGERTGRDCWDCTAYLDENSQRIANLSDDRRAIVERRLGLIAGAVAEQMGARG